MVPDSNRYIPGNALRVPHRSSRVVTKASRITHAFLRALYFSARLAGFAVFSYSGVCLASPSELEIVHWDYDSSKPSENSKASPGIAIADALTRMTECWNSGNLSGYLSFFWDSPQLSIVSDSSVLSGFRELNESYQRSYGDAAVMGRLEVTSVKIRMLKPDFAQAISRWTFYFPKTNHAVAGIDTSFLRRSESGWRIVTGHTTTADL
jgi:uncharacterized protein (TIGR02246 family)